MNQKNVLILVIVAVILLIGGWVIYLSKNRTGNLVTNYNYNSPSTSSNLTTYTNEQYKIKFDYPSGWTILRDDTTTPTSATAKTFQIKSPNNFTIAVNYQPTAITGTCDNTNNMGSDTINVLNTNLNIYFVGDKTRDTISRGYLFDKATACDNFPFMTSTQIPGQLEAQMYYDNYQEKAVADFKGLDYQTAKQIISSVRTY